MLKWYKILTPFTITSFVVARDQAQARRHVAGEIGRLIEFLRDREWDIAGGTVSCAVMETEEDWYEREDHSWAAALR